MEDLISIGTIGLIKAVETFDAVIAQIRSFCSQGYFFPIREQSLFYIFPDNRPVNLLYLLPETCLKYFFVHAFRKTQPQKHKLFHLLRLRQACTPFYERYGAEWEYRARTGETTAHLPSEEEEREMYRITENLLLQAGYYRYEISNYSPAPASTVKESISTPST